MSAGSSAPLSSPATGSDSDSIPQVFWFIASSCRVWSLCLVLLCHILKKPVWLDGALFQNKVLVVACSWFLTTNMLSKTFQSQLPLSSLGEIQVQAALGLNILQFATGTPSSLLWPRGWRRAAFDSKISTLQRARSSTAGEWSSAC